MHQNQNHPSVSNQKEETVAELVHRHMMDPTHETTDEELRNVKLDAEDNLEVKALEKQAELTGTDDPSRNFDDRAILPQDAVS